MMMKYSYMNDENEREEHEMRFKKFSENVYY